MKRVFLLVFVAGIMSTGFVSCREQKSDVGDDIEDVVDDIEDAVD